jgi:hypothetical protein
LFAESDFSSWLLQLINDFILSPYRLRLRKQFQNILGTKDFKISLIENNSHRLTDLSIVGKGYEVLGNVLATMNGLFVFIMILFSESFLSYFRWRNRETS